MPPFDVVCLFYCLGSGLWLGWILDSGSGWVDSMGLDPAARWIPGLHVLDSVTFL